MKMLSYLSALLLAAGGVAGAQEPASQALVRTTAWADANRIALPPLPSGLVAEPADSLYRLARTALNDGDFRKAAQLFQAVAERYPDSPYAPDALYWRAYALFRGAGSSRELQVAVEVLDRQEQRYPKAGTLGDARQLRSTIRAELARKGSAPAWEAMQQDAKKLNAEKGCPTDDDDARLLALVGIVQSDPDQAMPVLQKILARTDECSVKLRQRAVLLLAQTKEEERSDILLKVASTDPNTQVRREAVQWLAEVNTERAVKALDSVLFSASDADMRERALSALSRHRNPAARASIRKFAEQTNIPTDLRVRAVNNIANGPRRTPEDAEFLYALFNKTASPELREAIIEGVYQLGRQSGSPMTYTVAGGGQQTLVRTGGPRVNDKTLSWMMSIARDKKQETEVRKKALYWASAGGAELKDLLALYDDMADQPEMQEQMLFVYRQRKEPEATDKLMQIAKNEKNADLRRKAIMYLGEKKDPRVRQFLLDLVNP